MSDSATEENKSLPNEIMSTRRPPSVSDAKYDDSIPIAFVAHQIAGVCVSWKCGFLKAHLSSMKDEDVRRLFAWIKYENNPRERRRTLQRIDGGLSSGHDLIFLAGIPVLVERPPAKQIGLFEGWFCRTGAALDKPHRLCM